MFLCVFSLWVMFDFLWPPWTVGCQAPLSMEFSRQEYWSRLQFPTPGYLPNLGIKLTSLALAGEFFTTEPPDKPLWAWYQGPIPWLKQGHINQLWVRWYLETLGNPGKLGSIYSPQETLTLTVGHLTQSFCHLPISPIQFSSVQSLSRVLFFEILWSAACHASLSITNHQGLHKLMYIMSMMPSNHLILYHPLLLLPSIFPSIRFFSNESVLCIKWPEYWSFSFSISPSNEYSGLTSFRTDWLDLLAVLHQHHSSKSSILRLSAFFIVPTLASIHDYWKNHSFD